MIDILDVDEATVSSEIRLAQMQAEFEALFNGPLIEMEMMAAQMQAGIEGGFPPSPQPSPIGRGSITGGQDGTDWRG